MTNAVEARPEADGKLDCTAMGDMCRCLHRQDFEGRSSGMINPIGSVVTIDDSEYDYCLANDNTRLLWSDRGTQRVVVMRHSTAEPLPQRIEREPITIPR